MRLNRPKSKFLKKPRVDARDAMWPFVKERFDYARTMRAPYERQWIVNLSFLNGKQYSYFSIDKDRIVALRPVRGRIRNVDNQLVWRYRRQVADLIKNDPRMSVVPNSNDPEDIRAAKIGDKVASFFWRNNKMRGKLRQAGGWMYSTGNVFIDDRWNPRLGPIQTDDKGNVVYAGDVDCGVWSPFEVFVPFTAMTDFGLDGQPWMIKAKIKSLKHLEDEYKRGGEVPEESLGGSALDQNFISPMSSENLQRKDPCAVLMNFYMKPCSEFPKGKFIVCANGIVLEEQDYPQDHYHLEHIKEIEVPGMFYGECTLRHAIPLQKIWNRTISSIDEFNRTMGKGKGLVPKGAGLQLLPDNTHGEWIQYKPVMGLKPEIMTMKSMPPSFDLMLKIAGGSLQDMYSQHEVTEGTNKSDIRSGEMVSLLREQDAHGNIPSHQLFNDALENIMSRVLRRIAKGYDGERMLQVVGRDNEFDIFAFKGADLRNNTDVAIRPQGALPDSRAARQAMIMERFQGGLYGDPADPEVRRHVMTMLEDAVVEDLYSDTRMDEKYARWENEQLMKGKDIYLINQYDNHGIHMMEHNRFRKSMDFQRLKDEDPDVFMLINTAFDEHTAVHQKFLEEARQRMLQEQLLLSGKEGEGARR